MEIQNPENEIYLFEADARSFQDGHLQNEALKKIKPERREKILRRREEDRMRSLAAEMLLTEGLSKLGISYANEKIIENEYGKPYLESQKIFFNFSHSGDRVFLALSPNEVGCDVEIIRKPNLKIAERYFTEEEKKAIESAKNKEEAFYTIWTLKESFVKCEGKGFAIPFSTFGVFLLENGQWTDVPIGDRIYRMFTRKKDGYVFSVCLKK